LKDAYADFRVRPYINVRVGQFKQPFSREEMMSDNLTDFVERSVINELSPSRDIGVMAFGTLFERIVGYQVSVSNGTGEDAADNNDAKDVAGRLVVAPFRTTKLAWVKNLELGANATFGEEAGLASAQGRTTGRTSPRFTYFVAQPARGERTRWGADLGWSWGPVGVIFEYAQQSNERDELGPGGADLDDVVAEGWYLAATWLLTGEDKVLGGVVVPRRNFSPWTGTWGPGAWQVGVRYAELAFSSDDPVDFFDGNLAAITGGGPTAENGVQALTVGLNWYLNPRVRAMFNWTQYWYDNDLGTPFSCELSTCTAAGLTSGDGAWEIETSIQLWF
jgi:phosphate-selective porin OprO/OprP